MQIEEIGHAHYSRGCHQHFQRLDHFAQAYRSGAGRVYGDKVAFDLRGSQVIVTRADESSQEDPAIASFLALLEKDIHMGKHLCNSPHGLVQAMQAVASLPVDLDANIEGDAALWSSVMAGIGYFTNVCPSNCKNSTPPIIGRVSKTNMAQRLLIVISIKNRSAPA